MSLGEARAFVADAEQIPAATAVGRALVDSVCTVLLGKRAAVRLVVACLLGGGHVLIEDDPGVGKTLLAKALARSLDTVAARVQGSVDLLPTDVTGVSVYDPSQAKWEFHPGPVFHHVLLFDEINRATPRAQAALLEAMGERTVTVDGTTRILPDPFLVIATQNTLGDVGTFPLPMGQRDRFSMLVTLGLPDEATERRVLRGEGGEVALRSLRPVAGVDEWSIAIDATARVHVSEFVLDYVQAVLAATREHPEIADGASPRAGQILLRSAQALAALDGRAYVLPDDVKSAAPAVLAHRLRWRSTTNHNLVLRAADVIGTVTIPVP